MFCPSYKTVWHKQSNVCEGTYLVVYIRGPCSVEIQDVAI